MKYFLKVLIALVLAAGVVAGVYYYTNNKTLPFELKKNFSTTVTKEPATEKYAKRTLIASLDDEDFRLYKSKGSVILEHGDKEFTFDNWSSVIDAETPKMYYTDIDDDGEKELLIRAVSGTEDDTGDYIYEIYVLNPKGGKKEDYDVLLISQDTWRTVLDDQVTEELSQLKSCSKILQFAMDEKGSAISYDSESGMVKKAAYVGYAKALQDNDGNYMTLYGWTKSKGLFFIDDDNNIKVEVDCIATYDESHLVQNIGKIYFTLSVNEKNKLSVVPKSMYFTADEKYKVSDPRDTAETPWSFTRNNSFSPENGGGISWAKYHIDMDSSVITDTQDLAGEETDIKYVKAITVNQSGITLEAADNYTISDESAKKGDFSVVINKGKDNEYEISYTASVSKDKRSVYISFDKAYKQEDIGTIDISYGSK